MMTHLGRVVYDRKKNPFSQADITRILKTALDDMTPREAAEYMTQVLDPYYQKWRAHPFIFAGFMRGMVLGWLEAMVYTREFLIELLGFV